MASAVLWAIGFALHLADAAAEGVLTGLFITAGFFGGYFTLRSGRQRPQPALRDRLLMLVAAAGAWILGRWHEGRCCSALFSVGHALEVRDMVARRAIEALAELTPTTAMIRSSDGEREVPVESLAVGDVVVVKPNARIPPTGSSSPARAASARHR